MIAWSPPVSQTTSTILLRRLDLDQGVAVAKLPAHSLGTPRSAAALEARLAEIKPKRLILTHMSDDMLERLGSLPHEAASDGLVVEI
jgi:phosphoribosyl 1,2-cyclic phosphodiesterase